MTNPPAPATARYMVVVDVMLILVRDGQVLLSQRQGTGYADGQWNLVSGKLEAGEDMVAALIRETCEEIGITIEPEEARLVTTVHYLNPEGEGRVGFFFEVISDPACQGEPVNAEPQKCGALEWFPFEALPPATVPYTAAGVRQYRQGQIYGTEGWS